MSIINRRDRNRISDTINDKLPEFVRQDHRKFVLFLETYYKWLEDNENAFFAPSSTFGLLDIDETPEEFIKYFKQQYMADFPEVLAFDQGTGKYIDERGLIKRIRDFYKSKGTEKSFKLLFQILFDAYSEVYQPSSDILAPSDGVWINPTIMRVSNIFANPDELIGSNVIQYDYAPASATGGTGEMLASAKVDDVEQIIIEGYPVLEISLVEKDGDFAESNNLIRFVRSNVELASTQIYPMIKAINFTSAGTGYKVDDKVVITKSPTDSAGYGLRATVESVVTGTGADGGSIRKIRIDDGGINYQTKDLSTGSRQADSNITYSVSITSETGTGATGFSVDIGTSMKKAGYWLNNNGMPSSTEHLADNLYYQPHSYVIKTERPFDEYESTLQKLIHPAGKKAFGEILIQRINLHSKGSGTETRAFISPVIGNYTPYSIATEADGATTTIGVYGVVPSHLDLRRLRFTDRQGVKYDYGDFFNYGYAGTTAATAGYSAAFTSQYLIRGWTGSPGTTGQESATPYGTGLSAGWDTQRLWGWNEYNGNYGGAWDHAGATAPGWTSGNPSDNNAGAYWWIIHSHPNTRGTGTILPGTSWGMITIDSFLRMDHDHYTAWSDESNKGAELPKTINDYEVQD